KAIGEIAWQVGSIATGVGGAAKGGVALAKAGIKVGGAQLEKMAEIARIEKLAAKNAKNPNPMSSMTDSEAGNLVDRNVLEAKEKAPEPTDTPPVKNGWKVGDDVYNKTAKGNDPSWTTVRSRFWKNEAATTEATSKYGAENIERMKKGLAPQRYNADKGGMESMELSHEPVPFRDGGKDFVPRWPQDHAAVDPYRKPGY
ncbi:hypothetical protein P4A91_25365, partial [Pseudomonas syringae]|nr:hypothetical protein [Pseudomonas syringae]